MRRGADGRVRSEVLGLIIILSAFVADSPARAKALGWLVHNAFKGCGWCDWSATCRTPPLSGVLYGGYWIERMQERGRHKGTHLRVRDRGVLLTNGCAPELVPKKLNVPGVLTYVGSEHACQTAMKAMGFWCAKCQPR